MRMDRVAQLTDKKSQAAASVNGRRLVNLVRCVNPSVWNG